MSLYIRNAVIILFAILPLHVFAIPQWCVAGSDNGPCADTPEAAAKYHMDIYNVGGKCSKEYQGVTASDQYGPLIASYKIEWGKSGNNPCPNTTNGFVKRMYPCPAGTQLDPVLAICTKYALAVGDGNPPPQQCTGNPIEINSGNKIQQEEDIFPKGKGLVSFYRVYSGSGGQWHHNYDLKLKNVDPYAIEVGYKNKSSDYGSMADACGLGWAEIRGGINESWAVGATAQLKDNSCQIIKNGVVARVLPLIPANPQYIRWIPGEIHLIRADGSSFSFQYLNKLDFTSINGSYGAVKRIPPNYMADANAVAWVFTDTQNQIEEYSADGKLLSITSPTGSKQTLGYDANTGLLSQVQDSVGGKLLFLYENNLLSGVKTDANKTIGFSYNGVGLLSTVTRPDNTTRQYHYEDARFPRALTGITDERGARYATWTYDDKGRAISSEHANGADKTLLGFNADGSVTVTNTLDKKTTYRFGDILGGRRIVSVEGQPTSNCLGANQNYTYTPEGWLASKTDWKGIKTTYQYNTKGQEVSRTEAEGTAVAKIITTEWHPTLNVKTKVTEPDKETAYSYDEKGVVTKQSVKSTKVQ